MDQGVAVDPRVAEEEVETDLAIVESGNEREAGGAEEDLTMTKYHFASKPESLASLLVSMTEKVQQERSQRGKAEKHNQALLLELDHLQKEVLALRAACAESEQKISSKYTDISEATAPVVRGDTEVGEICWKELLECKKMKEKAFAEAHQWKMQVMELNACISMQDDELAALRTRANERLAAFEKKEAEAKELRHENQVHAQESKLLHDNVQHLTAEMKERGTHFKAIVEKWTDAQGQHECRERETSNLREQLQVARQRAEVRERELEVLRDERKALQQQLNQLKGAVAAKTAESKAFQTYGASAREHLQSQQAAIQRHAVYRRKVNNVARSAIVSLHGVRATVAQTRAPLLSMQQDFRQFIEKLRTPVTTLVARSSRYARAAYIEHAPLRTALLTAELTRQHLHEQVWRARRDALVVCQLQNVPDVMSKNTNEVEKLVLRANYSNGELFLRQTGGDRTGKEVLGVKCDAIFSDRARDWDRHESITPLLQSVLDGCNACVTTFANALPLRIGATVQQTVPELLLRELFAAIEMYGSDSRFRRVIVTISFLAVFNETVYDLLGLERTVLLPKNGNASAGQQMVVLEVQNAEEALMVLVNGRENLVDKKVQQYESAPMLTASLTHTVVTVCLSYENLLTGIKPIKSKLQIVELALGSGDGAKVAEHPSLPLSDTLEEVKQRVAVENGADALVTALAEVRLKDVAFVRYHSSKLTVLLQDTIKPGAKFLALVALPSSYSTSTISNDINPAAVVRILQLMRSAVGDAEDSRIALRNNNRDRSLEGFMNRLALQQSQQNGGLTLPFSSIEMQDHARRRAIAATSWSTELENLTKKYGQGTLESLIVTPPAMYYHKADDDNDQPHHLTTVHPISFHPPPVPIDNRPIYRKGSKSTRRHYDQSAVSAKKMLPSRAVRSVRLAATATATTASAPLRVQSMAKKSFKVRRDTASSVLKKAHRTLQGNRFPFR